MLTVYIISACIIPYRRW